jgi:hypothetical protein
VSRGRLTITHSGVGQWLARQSHKLEAVSSNLTPGTNRLSCRAMHNPDTRHEWVSVKAAAIHFGTSESDIRRRIKRGELMSESLSRPGGTLLRVKLPAPDTRQPIESPPTPDTRQDIASGLLARLADQDAAIVTKDAEIARLNAEVRTLAERAARAESDAEHTREALDWTEARRAQAEGELERMRARSVWKPWTW